ncbi:MAG: sensor histidine kinase, partial [Bacteroidia bacterium]
CVQEVVDSLADLANKKNIQIRNQIMPSQTCFADVNMTTLVIRNLISNSIKFTEENGTIDVSSKELDHQMLISIADNGIGLTAQQINSFNEAGFDENAKTTLGTHKEKGTGIGLMLCRTFTQLMHGKLTVQSQREVGTTFTLMLPKVAQA